MIYVLIVIGFLILLAGGKALVDGASAIAAKLGMSPGMIGMTIVAFGTSAPELLVSVTAALKGTSDIAIGNVVGSNISNISLVLGISALIYPIRLNFQILKFDYSFTLFATVLFYLLALNNWISIWDGIMLFALLIIINWYYFKKSDHVPEEFSTTEAEKAKNEPLLKSIGYILVGILGLYFGAEMLVNNAVTLAQEFGISERIIGVTIIAIGTSLPELATSVIAARKKETDIALGNILGSNMQNILSIIGVTAIIKPIEVSDLFLSTDFLWMIGFTVLLFPIMRSGYKISRLEGGILLVVYGLYLIFLL
ncbi:calcium/sodium antiporter [Echinicola vietnamensis]|uniref:K+dependent Na+ exchanger related-protein n=1 Tax=Echinicola vietnamensis (strain DSM 17526 / LMG 23754 / KMM 6221) TaxID=926556 RepID=L0FVT5_ECHVK|nr:calcium/sodium antiporter [Echinicola vietnamensis]AGA76876.1 K+dependent Na+ exchanger related-protein [Echinicola vietnamensis DSM 17526]